MADEPSNLGRIDEDTIPDRLQAAGVAGAGGAGFPSYVKWQNLDDIDYLLVNHQESEPNYYADKWLGCEHADELADLIQWLVNTVFDAVVVGTKQTYRDEWIAPFEEATGAEVALPDYLPLDIEDKSSVIFAYTPDVYTYSEEKTLLMVTAHAQIGDDLPTEHSWIVHNTETLYNINRALCDGKPVTRKYVHVDGNTPRHRCLDVPIGTPAAALLEAAGIENRDISDDEVLADGGPGWCYKIDLPPEEFGVRKRTNALLVLNEALVEECVKEDGQIDVLKEREWAAGEHETEPVRLDPDRVRIPLITNMAYEGVVAPSEPIVETGDTVTTGDVIAEPASEVISNMQHASIDGTVAAVTDTHIVIER